MSPREVGDRLAVLGGEQAREIVELAVDEFQELEHDAGTALWIGGGPGRESGLCIGDRFVDVGLVSERDPGLHFAGIGIEDIAEPARGAFYCLAADEMTDLAHRLVSLGHSAAITTNAGYLAVFLATGHEVASRSPRCHGHSRFLTIS